MIEDVNKVIIFTKQIILNSTAHTPKLMSGLLLEFQVRNLSCWPILLPLTNLLPLLFTPTTNFSSLFSIGIHNLSDAFLTLNACLQIYNPDEYIAHPGHRSSSKLINLFPVSSLKNRSYIQGRRIFYCFWRNFECIYSSKYVRMIIG